MFAGACQPLHAGRPQATLAARELTTSGESGTHPPQVRVSCLPTDVSAGAHEIQSFCQGHRNFVSAVALVEGLVVSGGGDGTLRLWNPLDGTLLHTLALGEGSDVEGKAPPPKEVSARGQEAGHA